MSNNLETQNRMIIALLARSTIGIKEIERIVRTGKKKGNPDDFVSVYNALDGTKSGTALAKVVGITKQGMSSVLQTWEEEGIVYKNDETGFYVGLLKLHLKKKSPAAKESNISNSDLSLGEEVENDRQED